MENIASECENTTCNSSHGSLLGSKFSQAQLEKKPKTKEELLGEGKNTNKIVYKTPSAPFSLQLTSIKDIPSVRAPREMMETRDSNQKCMLKLD
jgi:hypothetical protein